jgi:hypothetical protein
MNSHRILISPLITTKLANPRIKIMRKSKIIKLLYRSGCRIPRTSMQSIVLGWARKKHPNAPTSNNTILVTLRSVKTLPYPSNSWSSSSSRRTTIKITTCASNILLVRVPNARNAMFPTSRLNNTG